MKSKTKKKIETTKTVDCETTTILCKFIHP